MRLGRYDDAVKARRNSLRLLGPTAEREADLGEALTGAANGIVTAEAKAAFDRALALDPEDFRARYFSGLAAEQDGRPKDAADIWTKLLAGAPADAAWIGFVRESLLRVDPNASVPQARPKSRRRMRRGRTWPERGRCRGREPDVARAARRPWCAAWSPGWPSG